MLKLKGNLAAVMAFLFILQTVFTAPLGATAAAAPLTDGEYPVGFYYYEDGKQTASKLQDYSVAGSGKLIVQNGTATFQHEIIAKQDIPFVGILKDGASRAVISGGKLVSGAENYISAYGNDPNATTASYVVNDLSKTYDILIHVYISTPQIQYDNWYPVQLKLDASEIIPGTEGDPVSLEELNTLIAEAQSLHDTITEGTGDGYYPAGTKNGLHIAIQKAAAVAAEEDAAELEFGQAFLELSKHVEQVKASKIAVDKAALRNVITEAQSVYAASKPFGAAAVADPVTYTGATDALRKYIVSEGEIPDTPISTSYRNKLQTLLTAAIQDRDNVQVSQQQVNGRVLDLQNYLVEIADNIATQRTGRFVVLDSRSLNAAESEFASYFVPETVEVISGAKIYERITIKNYSEFKSKFVSLDWYSATYNPAFSDGTSIGSKQTVREITNRPDKDEYTGQLILNSTNLNATNGLLPIVYKTADQPAIEKTLYLNFNVELSHQLKQAVDTAQARHDGAETGTGPGQYGAGAKDSFQAVITEVKLTADHPAAARADIHAASARLELASQQFEAARVPDQVLADGNYYVDFKVLKAGSSEASVMQTFVLTPGMLHVVGNNKTFYFTIKQDSVITGFKLNGENVPVLFRDSATNTRVVYFTVPNLTTVIDGWVKIESPENHYSGEDQIRLQFDPASATATQDALPAPSPSPTPTPSPTPSPSPGTSPTPSPSPIPSTSPEPSPGTSTAPTPTPSPSISPTLSPGTNPGTGPTPSSSPTPSAKPGPSPSPGTGNGEAPAKSFSDTKGHWAEAAIVRAEALGIVKGYSDGSFHPENPVTRGEFAVMLSRALKLDTEAEEASSFRDSGQIPDWASSHASAIQKQQLIQGYADGSFRPSGSISRAELAVIIARAAKLDTSAESSSAFADNSSIPKWAVKEVAAAVKAGLLEGKADNAFDPQASATRAEVITLIVKLLDWQAVK